MFFKENLYKIDHPISKAMIWKIFYDMVTEGKITSLEFVNIL